MSAPCLALASSPVADVRRRIAAHTVCARRCSQDVETTRDPHGKPAGDLEALSKTPCGESDNTPNTTAIYCVAFSPDGKQVITGGMDQSLKLWNVADGKPAREFKAYKEKESAP